MERKYRFKRTRIVQPCSCTTSDQGNFCVRYDINNKTLKVQLPWEIKKDSDGKKLNNFFDINKVEFTYNNHLYLETLNKKGSVISYRIEDYG